MSQLKSSEEIYAGLPVPDAVSVGGFSVGETPFVTLTYRLDPNDKVLEELIAAALRTAKAAE